MASIKNFIAQNGSSFIDNSVTVNAVQSNTQNNNEVVPEDTGGRNIERRNDVTLNPAKGFKTNLYRTIIALHELGFFVDKSGCQANQKDVFEAFGEALRMDFSKFHKNLSEASKKKNEVTIFQQLERAFLEYEEQKLERSQNQR